MSSENALTGLTEYLNNGEEVQVFSLKLVKDLMALGVVADVNASKIDDLRVPLNLDGFVPPEGNSGGDKKGKKSK